ncbi:hypothetical protein DPMN_094842 [Dreissena polymorpha]|uniref:Uncharacterized protein n=1 Tax=Dreissena polymorpha TaxID=45954 RepID=A0A9D4L690_DREPO|nr:hypothetical protein DPMN_094842 [Dreissena polymorpha]
MLFDVFLMLEADLRARVFVDLPEITAVFQSSFGSYKSLVCRGLSEVGDEVQNVRLEQRKILKKHAEMCAVSVIESISSAPTSSTWVYIRTKSVFVVDIIEKKLSAF